MREMEFKMERIGLVEIGQEVEIREGRLPYSYYYVVEPAVAMSGNFPLGERLFAQTGTVTEITEEDGKVLELHVAEGDMGKVIGRQGRIAKEIRTIVKTVAQRTGEKVTVEIVD